MKKIIYSIMLAFILATSFSACTDENIRPQDGEGQKDPGQHDK